MEGQVITNMDLTHLLELHTKRRSTITFPLYKKAAPVAAAPKKGKAEDRKRKENYKVYGTFMEQEFSDGRQQARIALFQDSMDFEIQCGISKGLLQRAEKVTLWGDYAPINICVCSPSLLKYCSGKKHSFLSFFVSCFFAWFTRKNDRMIWFHLLYRSNLHNRC